MTATAFLNILHQQSFCNIQLDEIPADMPVAFEI